MGWSHTTRAGNVLDRFDAANHARGESSANAWTDPKTGRRYFYETTRRDQPDGGICGAWHEVFTRDGVDYARRVGSFRINGDGTCPRGPAGMRAEAEKETQADRNWAAFRADTGRRLAK